MIIDVKSRALQGITYSVDFTVEGIDNLVINKIKVAECVLEDFHKDEVQDARVALLGAWRKQHPSSQSAEEIVFDIIVGEGKYRYQKKVVNGDFANPIFSAWRHGELWAAGTTWLKSEQWNNGLAEALEELYARQQADRAAQ